jgi:2,4-dienoyl-CoA reductase (NADPH2)
MPATEQRDVVVIGAGPAGLETARVAALRGHRTWIVEQRDRIGGMAAIAGPHASLIEWYGRELKHLGVEIVTGVKFPDQMKPVGAIDPVVVQCTGSQRGTVAFEIGDDPVPLLDIADVRRGDVELPVEGTIVVFDPIGGPIGIAIAEEVGERATLVTQDNIPGNELSRSGDLAPASVRLFQAGASIERRSILRGLSALGAEVEDRYSGERRTIACTAVVDCGFRLPDHPIDGVTLRAGAAVAPRTVHEAVLEGRRVAHGI